MNTFAEPWGDIILYAGFGFVALSLLVTLFYFAQLASIGRRTEKYAFASKRETKAFRSSGNIFAAGIAFFAFMGISQFVGDILPFMYVFVAFFAIIISVAVGGALSAFTKYYYPFILEKRLNNIRFKKMKSPQGNVMRLLNEVEEDEYMTQEMIDEEDALIADYDIWLDEKTGEKVVEKYDISNDQHVCEKCNFRTLSETNMEVTKEPTMTEPGAMVKQFQCSYCGHKQIKEMKISALQDASAAMA
ncbi:MAG: hypothetical protein RIC35_05380 [Marinoscillum sp.]